MSGRVINKTYFHFSRLGITLKAFGTLPERYVEKILPISPYTLRTYGLSKDFELASFNFSSNLFSQSDESELFPVKPSILRMLASALDGRTYYFLEL